MQPGAAGGTQPAALSYLEYLEPAVAAGGTQQALAALYTQSDGAAGSAQPVAAALYMQPGYQMPMQEALSTDKLSADQVSHNSLGLDAGWLN
jgi:hypothetical protein